MAAHSRDGLAGLSGAAFRIREYRPGSDDPVLLDLWSAALGAVWPGTPAAILSRFTRGRHLVAEDAHGGAGFIGAHVQGESGHLAVLLVRPDAQRRGIGTALLDAVLADLRRRGVTSVSLGSGAGPYFWSGVPENLPGAMAFFRKNGWSLTYETADMEADLTGYTTPGWILDREARAEIGIQAATAGETAEILAFEEKHFPEWHDYFRSSLARRPDSILVARDARLQLAGTVMVDLPDPTFVWEPLMPGAGAFGCIGVAEAFRERGIGMALCARSHERLAAAGVRRAFLGWVVLFDWYAKLGYKRWRTYWGSAKRLR